MFQEKANASDKTFYSNEIWKLVNIEPNPLLSVEFT
jgi:hypothetical protein